MKTSDSKNLFLRHTLLDRLFPPASVGYSFYSMLEKEVDLLQNFFLESPPVCIAPVKPACPPNIFHIHLYEKLQELVSCGCRVILLFFPPDGFEMKMIDRFKQDVSEHLNIVNPRFAPEHHLDSEFTPTYIFSDIKKLQSRLVSSIPQSRRPFPQETMGLTVHAALELNVNFIIAGEMEFHNLQALNKVYSESHREAFPLNGVFLPLLDWATPELTIASSQNQREFFFKRALSHCENRQFRRGQDGMLIDLCRYFFYRDLNEIDIYKKTREDFSINEGLDQISKQLSVRWQECVMSKWYK